MNSAAVNTTDTNRHPSHRASWARRGRLWHRRLAWVGAAALLLFGLSGLTHPLMTWFGPQPAAFFPPQTHFDRSEIAALPGLLAQHRITRAQQVRILPTFDGSVLQVTDEHATRRYFDLRSGDERVNFDRRHAEWLARHYTGLHDTSVRELSLQSHFDHAYPDVNRLLPVWKVVFDSDDGLTAFVHTELNALAALGNSARTTQQGIFRSLHSFSWLGDHEALRVIILTGLTLSLIGLGLAGLVLVFALPGRTMTRGQRRWHRYLSLLLWLPLLAFAFSGLCHLLHHANPSSGANFRPAPPLDLTPLHSIPPEVLHDVLEHQSAATLSGVTLLQAPDGKLLLRLARPAGPSGEHVHQHARFEGTPTEQPSQLIALNSPASRSWSDRDLARHFAAAHLKLDAADLIDAELVTRFGPDYDFRNKRLPVWRVRHAGGSVFIDPANGALVDSVTRPDRWEGLSFSHLHKWNFLTPALGREGRDLVVTAVVVALLVSTILGISMLLRPHCQRWRARYAATLLRRKPAH